jgi:transposase
MRGGDDQTSGLSSYVSCEARVPADHPLRAIRAIVDEALEVLSLDFAAMYSPIGRPSIPPEKLLRALLLQAFYTIGSERQLMKQIDYNLLFRWFIGLAMDAPIWDVTVFTRNRERLLAGDIAAKFLSAVIGQPRVRVLLSDEHFSVDGTLIEAWSSMKSFKPKVAPSPAAMTMTPALGLVLRKKSGAAIQNGISTAKSAAMRPMPPAPIRMLACSRRRVVKPPSCATWAMS